MATISIEDGIGALVVFLASAPTLEDMTEEEAQTLVGFAKQSKGAETIIQKEGTVAALLRLCKLQSSPSRRLALSVIAGIASHESEALTDILVSLGTIRVVSEVLMDYQQPTEKHAIKFQISESVWFRDAILNTFAELGDPEANFLRDLYSDSVNERERYKLSEILLNCDLMKDMYFPGKPWYQPHEVNFPWLDTLKQHYDIIKKEALSLENLVEHPEKNICTEGWNVHVLWAFQTKLENNCNLCPETTRILNDIPNVSSAIFSYLKPRAHIKPHVGYYQYSESILRVHFGLDVPPGCTLRVNGISNEWREGEFLIFDDTFRHEAWNPSKTDTRVVLMFDVLYDVAIEHRNPNFLEKSKEKVKAMGGNETNNILLTPALLEGLQALGAASEKVKAQLPN